MNRAHLKFTLMIILAIGASAEGATVSYDFSGTFATPVDGSTQFHGTFRYDTSMTSAVENPLPNTGFYKDLPTNPAGTFIDMSFSVGDASSSSIGPIVDDNLSISPTASYDLINLSVAFNHKNRTIWQIIAFENDNTINPGPLTSGLPPTELLLSSFNKGGKFLYQPFDNPTGPYVVGTITSLTATVPEPSTVAVLLTGICGGALRSRMGRKRSGRPTSSQ